VRGDLSLAARPCVAIGRLRATPRPRRSSWRAISRHALGGGGLRGRLGLARGIDGAAHEGALPATIGVIASGIDIAYPPQHEAAGAIARKGLLIAEQPPGTEPRGSHFPSRNRIIAGLALGTLVVEAAPESAR
jgi:DNA processing protein